MAKRKEANMESNDQAEAQTEAEAQAPAAAAETPKVDQRIRMVTIGGVTYARKDYIVKRWKEGASRGTIAKELGVSYQIVFQGTKGVAGGPVKKEGEPTAPQAPAEPEAA